ncbi:MAG: peptidoglycan DD-metalloendopeptidase family protein [Alistipes sp.]|nr:peptidoglycan DD-metalloendopeptidase family protein [Alistipes sp.]
MKKLLLTLATLLLCICSATAQNEAKIAEQRRAIASLEKQIAAEEAQISKLKKGRSDKEARARKLAKQIEARNQLLVETEREASLLRGEIARTDSVANDLARTLDRNRALYAELVRESYRNYRQNNYISYIFSSRSFSEIARRLSAMREMAALRERKMQEITQLQNDLTTERTKLDRQKNSLDSVKRNATRQKQRLQRDVNDAKNEIKRMTRNEKEALQRKLQQEQQLSVAINELRKLTKGNKEGASFSSKTTALNLPVVGGKVKRYKGNMAEITGSKGAVVRSIYEGKVVEVKRNRITAKYEVFVAHGEYITSYANLGATSVEKGAKVTKNQAIGTIGTAVDPTTMNTEYKLVFGIFSPNPSEVMSAANCFKK